MSKDPSTKVGAVIVDDDLIIRATGFNGFPRGIADTPERLNDRDMKLRMIVHAERNALLNAARVGVSVKGCTLYLSACSATGRVDIREQTKSIDFVWGGAPCTHCTIEIIQAGITRVVSPPMKNAPSRWHDDLLFAKGLLEEAGVQLLEIEP